MAPALLPLAALLIGAELFYPPPEWGKVPPEDLRARNATEFQDRDAIILFDRVLAGPFGMIRHYRMKILTDAGASQQADVELPDWVGHKIDKIQAQTILPSSEKVKVKEFYSQGIDDLQTKRFTFPAVEPGAVLEYAYTADTWGTPSFYFQNDVFTRLAEISIPKWYTPQTFGTGIMLAIPAVEEGPKYRVWRLEGVPPLQGEPLAPLLQDYRTGLHFASKPSSIAKFWSDAMDEFMKKGGPAEAWLAEHTAGIEDPWAKAEVVYRFLRDDVKPPEGGKYAENVGEVIRSGRATGFGRNTTLLFLLRKAGLEADPVLICPREGGHARLPFATTWRLQHLIVRFRVDETTYFADATASRCPLGTLPLDDHVESGRVMEADTSRTIPLGLPAVVSEQVWASSWSLAADGTLAGRTRVDYRGFEREEALEKLADSNAKDLATKMLEKHFKGAELKTVEVTGDADRDSVLTLDLAFRVPGWADLTATTAAIRAPSVVAMDRPPFTGEHRVLPIDFRYPHRIVETAVTHLPEGWQVKTSPMTVRESGSGLAYRMEVKAAADSIRIHRTFEVSDPSTPPEKYPVVQKVFGRVVAGDAGRVQVQAAGSAP